MLRAERADVELDPTGLINKVVGDVNPLAHIFLLHASLIEGSPVDGGDGL